MRNVRSLTLGLLLAGCGGGSPATDAAVDAAAPADQAVADLAPAGDLAYVDLSSPDLEPKPDLAKTFGTCMFDTDCRLFSNYCSDAPCTCAALAEQQNPPPCNGMMVTCLYDPCQGKMAVCSAGRCFAQ